MNPSAERVCDARELEGLIASMARQIAEAHLALVPLYLVGIRTRGVPLAQRLASALQPLLGAPVQVGAVDITFYRDDLGKADHWPELRGTEIAFDVDGAEIVVVDDVLFTGRTVRAALNAICDLGRPARVRLAVLVDRGHREIPIQPDVVGLRLETARTEHVRVALRPADPEDEIVRMAARSRAAREDRSPAP
jgi:pyrimidine operon attenuation protein / uracil phosphoribosyltransferase